MMGLPASAWLGAWAAGAILVTAAFALAEHRYRRLCRQGRGGPAVMGVWPRMVVPTDYRDRFSASERAMILRHERAHMARRDTLANLALVTVQAISWFNPLAHLAAGRLRLDQDLACDALALESSEVGRRTYGETLLKAHLDRQPSRLACAWAGLVGHPLELRVKLLSRRPLTAPRYVMGAAAVGLVVLLTVLAVWALAPSNQTLFGPL
jgi:beta-lactamase regulating signal transducer with metallopeptidase domain